ncbi:MAG: hemerythrin domain-containing protein [Ramlibacter sp.]|nr:hemerythrin domain-containing protein [Ramlibacter sp.]
MNIFEALRVSHETQRALSARLLASEAEGPERQQIFLDLKAELLAHETAEERCLYVPLFEHDVTVDASRHAIAEHHEMDEMVEDLEELVGDSVQWMAGARKLCAKVEHHLTEEENKFFQQAGKVLTEAQKLALAKEYEAEFLTLRVKETKLA